MPISTNIMPCRGGSATIIAPQYLSRETLYKVFACTQQCVSRESINCAAVGGAFQTFELLRSTRGFQLRPRLAENCSLKNFPAGRGGGPS